MKNILLALTLIGMTTASQLVASENAKMPQQETLRQAAAGTDPEYIPLAVKRAWEEAKRKSSEELQRESEELDDLQDWQLFLHYQ